jgi:hypothetical protein
VNVSRVNKKNDAMIAPFFLAYRTIRGRRGPPLPNGGCPRQ